MKLISLNTWGGRAGKDNMLSFFAEHRDVDFFCLQEMWSGGEHMLTEEAGGMKLADAIPQLLSALQEVLPEHRSYFKPHFFDFYGLVIFAKKAINVKAEGDVFVYKEEGWISEENWGNHARNLQYLTVDTPQGTRTILNLHGLWNGGGKGDSEDRLLQSERISAFLRTIDHPFVLCGDFNLLPDTKSIEMLEQFPLRNLIAEYGITSTRTRFYTKEAKFADYALVHPQIVVQDFKVLPDAISDHAPLYLEFN